MRYWGRCGRRRVRFGHRRRLRRRIAAGKGVLESEVLPALEHLGDVFAEALKVVDGERVEVDFLAAFNAQKAGCGVHSRENGADFAQMKLFEDPDLPSALDRVLIVA